MFFLHCARKTELPKFIWENFGIYAVNIKKSGCFYRMAVSKKNQTKVYSGEFGWTSRGGRGGDIVGPDPAPLYSLGCIIFVSLGCRMLNLVKILKLQTLQWFPLKVFFLGKCPDPLGILCDMRINFVGILTTSPDTTPLLCQGGHP